MREIPVPSHDIQEILSPSDMQDDFSRELVSNDDFGFIGAKLLSDGTYVGVKRLFASVAICIGIDAFTSYRRRYCYQNLSDCLANYEKLEKFSTIPEGWIATRP